MALNLFKVFALGFSWRNAVFEETLGLPTDTTLTTDRIGSTRWNQTSQKIETWNGTAWVGSGGGTSGGGAIYEDGSI